MTRKLYFKRNSPNKTMNILIFCYLFKHGMFLMKFLVSIHIGMSHRHEAANITTQMCMTTLNSSQCCWNKIWLYHHNFAIISSNTWYLCYIQTLIELGKNFAIKLNAILQRAHFASASTERTSVLYMLLYSSVCSWFLRTSISIWWWIYYSYTMIK